MLLQCALTCQCSGAVSFQARLPIRESAFYLRHEHLYVLLSVCLSDQVFTHIPAADNGRISVNFDIENL